jgi:serpin B
MSNRVLLTAALVVVLLVGLGQCSALLREMVVLRPRPLPTPAVVPPAAPTADSRPATPAEPFQTALGGRSRDTAPTVQAGDTQTLATGWNAFALRLLGAQPRDANLCFSPYSAAACLTMCYAGARGETARQMAGVLGLTLPAERLHPAANRLDQDLAALERAPSKIELKLANAVWSDKSIQPLPDFLDVLSVNYGAGLKLVDFKGAPEPSRAAINQWVADQTKGHITDLLAPGTIDSLTRLALTNAVYLLAPWQKPFDAKLTAPGPFTRADGTAVQTPLMHARGLPAPYAKGDDWTAVQLPYSDPNLALLLVLPAGKLADFEAKLSADRLTAIVDRLKPERLNLTLPSFEQRSRLHLAQALRDLGMSDAFNEQKADFTGIVAQPQLFLKLVEHQAWIKVDEKGTEAAAATAAVLGFRSAAPRPATEVRFDRPFLFAVRHVPSGAVLFLGRVTDPTAK